MNGQVELEEKQRKPRIFKSAAKVAFSLSGKTAVTFKELLKTFAEAINDYELPVEVQADRLIIRAMDSSRVRMADYALSKEVFDEWEVKPLPKYRMAELPIRFIAPISEVNYAVEKVTEESKVRFELLITFNEWKSKVEVWERKPERCPKCGLYTFESENQLPPEKRGKDGSSFKCKCKWRGKVKVWKRKVKVWNREVAVDSVLKILVSEKTVESFNVKVFTDNFEVVPKPKLQPTVTAKVSAKDFKAILERMRRKMQSVTLTATEKKLVLSGTGDMISMNVELEKFTDIVLDLTVHAEKQKAVYSLDNITSLLPSKPSIAQLIDLKFSTDMPLVVSWLVEHCSREKCSVDFYVAPIIYTSE